MVSKNKIQIFKSYINWLFYNDQNNGVVEAYNEYRRHVRGQRNLLPNEEATLKKILRDKTYLNDMYGYNVGEIIEWLKGDEI